jgi:hypothetical protein
MSRELDNILANLLQKQSSDLNDKHSVELTKDIVLEKVAFDLVRITSSPYNPYDGLWTLSESDGKKFLVRASDPRFESSGSGDWSAISDYDCKNVTLAYKNVPIHRFSSNDFGFANHSVSIFKSTLLEKTSSDNSFLKELLSEQSFSKRESLVTTFPELKKYI